MSAGPLTAPLAGPLAGPLTGALPGRLAGGLLARGDEPAGRAEGRLVLEQLLGGLEQVPAQRPVASRMVQLTHCDDTSSARLAAVAGADPSITARLMRLANSAYYGLSGRVRTVSFAVTVLGLTTVRGVAIAAAAGVDGDAEVPAGFWDRCAATAVAAGELARPLRLDPSSTFCLGLLAGFGQALLHRADRSAYSELVQRAGDRAALSTAERERYGVSHLEVSAAALEAWAFPADMPAALRTLDRWPVGRPAESLDLTGVCLVVASEVAERVVNPAARPGDVRHMTGGRLGEDEVRRLVERVPALAEDLVRAVTG